MRLARPAALLFALVCLFALAGCSESDDTLPQLQRDIPFRADGSLTFLRPDGSAITTIEIEIAEGDSAQARGLMQRRSLGYDRGMLFPYEEPSERAFWMRNTPLSLDIMFADADQRITKIAERAEPFSDARVRSDGPAQYVVEVRAGFAERFGLTAGSTRFEWSRE